MGLLTKIKKILNFLHRCVIMAEIQKGWKQFKIKDIASVSSGNGAPQNDELYGGNHIFVKAGDLNKLNDIKYVGKFSSRIIGDAIKEYNLKLFPKMSIVFPKSGMSVKTDNIALLEDDSFVVNHLAVITINDSEIINPLYVFYYLKRFKISNLSLNDSYPSIRLDDIYNFVIKIPPLETQNKIVEILEKTEKLKNYRERADNLTEDYLKGIFLEMFGDPILNNKKWDIEPLKKFGEIKTGNTPSRKNPTYYGNYIEWIKSDNINTPFTFLTRSEEKLSEEGFKLGRIVPKGSILVTCIAGSISCLGNVAVADREVAFNQQINSLTPNSNVNELFLYHLFLYTKKYLQNFSRSALKGIINKKTFESIPMIFPPYKLQEEFGRIVGGIEKIKRYQNQSKKEIDNLFNNLMQNTFKEEIKN